MNKMPIRLILIAILLIAAIASVMMGLKGLETNNELQQKLKQCQTTLDYIPHDENGNPHCDCNFVIYNSKCS